MHHFDFSSKFYQSVCPAPIQNNIHCWWIEIKKRPKYKLRDKIGDLSKTTFWYHNNDTKRNSWFIFCSHWPINDLSSCLPFTWQLCYKPLGILQRITKSQKVHIWSHDVSHTWGTPQNFLLAFIDELWKTQRTRISKRWPKKKKKTTHEKTKKTGDIIILHMCTKNHNQVQSPRYGVTPFNFVILGHFLPFTPPLPPPHLSFLTLEKPKFWKKEKSIWRCHHFKLVQQKTQSNDACLLRYGVWQTFYHFVILGHFLLF